MTLVTPAKKKSKSGREAERHQQRRTCLGCRSTKKTTVLSRLQLDVEGDIVFDGSAGGRGAWLCRATTIECFDRAVAESNVARGFRRRVSPGSLDAARAWIESELSATVAPK